MSLISDQQATVLFEGEDLHLPIFLDHQSTTPLAPEVKQVMDDAFAVPGNAQSKTHAFGLDAAERIETAREQVANLIGADADEIHFTSGATQANQIILKAAANDCEHPRHFICLKTEHASLLSAQQELVRKGHQATFLPVKENGRLDLAVLEAAIRPETCLVSIQAANNEIGTLQDINSIGILCKEHNIPFYSDGVQAVATERLDVKSLHLDGMSLSAHKIYGPQGIGALYVRRGLFSESLPKSEGTPATALIAGFGKASDLAHTNREKDKAHLLKLSGILKETLTRELGDDIAFNGDPVKRIPGCLNVSFKWVSAEDLLSETPELALSTSSACLSAEGEISLVLKAIGLDAAAADSSLRIGLGRYVTERESRYAAIILANAYRRLRS